MQDLKSIVKEQKTQSSFIQKLMSYDIFAGITSVIISQIYCWATQILTTEIFIFNVFVCLLFSSFYLLLRKQKILIVALLLTIFPSILVSIMVFFLKAPFSALILIPISINAIIFFPDAKLFSRTLAIFIFLFAVVLWISELPQIESILENSVLVFQMVFNLIIFIMFTFYKVVSLLMLSQFEHNLQEQSEQRLREFLTYSSEGIFNIRFQQPISLQTNIEQQIEDIKAYGYIQECNEAFAKLYGIGNASLIQGKNIGEINQVLWQNAGAPYYEQFAASGFRTSQTNVAYRNLLKEKKYISQSIVGIVKDQQLHGVWGIQQDVTEKVETQNSLIQNEEYLKTVLNSLRDSIWTIDKDCKLTGFNDYWIQELSQIGYPMPTIGETAVNYATPATIGRWVEWYESALSGQYIEGELEYLIQGQPHHCLVTITPSFDKNEAVNGAVVYAKDITKIKTAQDQLRQSEERYRSIFENSRLGICTSKGMEITRVNPAFANMTGYETSEIIGAPPTILISEDQHLALQQVIDNLKFGITKSADFELQFTRKDGSYMDGYVQMRGVYDQTGRYKESITTITDISKIKEASKALEEKNQSLEKYIESNMQLENFAYLASHDLKAPIRTILSFTQILHKKLQGRIDDKEQQFLDYIMNGAKGMDQLVYSLLEYSKVNSQKTNKDIIRLRELLDSVLEDLRANIEETDAEIILSFIPTAIFGDHVQIRQLFQNLIANAIKFRKKEEPLFVEIKAFEEANHWRFEVQDNGIGIDESFHDKIFQLFRKLHGPKDYEGTGIGLALCKKVVEQHGGEISLQSKLGEGTTFIFTIAKK